MRPSHLAVSLLVLFIFLSSVQGIRLEKSFKSAGHDHMQEGALIKNSNGVLAILFKQGHCSTVFAGKSRKLFTATTSTTTTSKREEINGENKANPISTLKSAVNEGGKQEKHHDQYVDIMDYSPARRKTPIHN